MLCFQKENTYRYNNRNNNDNRNNNNNKNQHNTPQHNDAHPKKHTPQRRRHPTLNHIPNHTENTQRTIMHDIFLINTLDDSHIIFPSLSLYRSINLFSMLLLFIIIITYHRVLKVLKKRFLNLQPTTLLANLSPDSYHNTRSSDQ